MNNKRESVFIRRNTSMPLFIIKYNKQPRNFSRIQKINNILNKRIFNAPHGIHFFIFFSPRNTLYYSIQTQINEIYPKLLYLQVLIYIFYLFHVVYFSLFLLIYFHYYWLTIHFFLILEKVFCNNIAELTVRIGFLFLYIDI